MKPEAQRIAIAEACGWQDVRPEWMNGRPSSLATYRQEIPDYLGDLNAIAEAEKTIPIRTAMGEPTLYLDYIEYLKGIVVNGVGRLGISTSMVSWTTMAEVARATAAQRAEAFLRTLGKWVEE